MSDMIHCLREVHCYYFGFTKSFDQSVETRSRRLMSFWWNYIGRLLLITCLIYDGFFKISPKVELVVNCFTRNLAFFKGRFFLRRWPLTLGNITLKKSLHYIFRSIYNMRCVTKTLNPGLWGATGIFFRYCSYKWKYPNQIFTYNIL